MTASMVPDAAPLERVDHFGHVEHVEPFESTEEHHELHPVRRRARARLRRRRTVAALTLFGLVVAGLLFSVVAAHVALTQNQFRLERLEKKAVEEQATYERLRLEVAELESPGRIVADAQNRLGMVQPDEVTYLSPDPTPTFAAPGDRTGAGAGSDAGPPPAAVAATNPAAGWQVVKPHLAER